MVCQATQYFRKQLTDFPYRQKCGNVNVIPRPDGGDEQIDQNFVHKASLPSDDFALVLVLYGFRQVAARHDKAFDFIVIAQQQFVDILRTARNSNL